MQCATHPDVETELRCGKCETPICPRCLHYTPVGVRCRTCANLKKLPQYEVPPTLLARAFGGAMLAGAGLGLLWGFVIPDPYFFFGLLVGLGLGSAIGEVVSLSANRKAGPQMQVLAAAGVVAAYVVRTAVFAADLPRYGFVDVLTDDLSGYIVAGLATVVAVGRVR
jgi:hypothetical protein